LGHRACNFRQELTVGVTEEPDRAVIGNRRIGRPSNQLVQHGKGVSHRSSTRSHHQGKNPLFNRDPLARTDRLNVGKKIHRGNESERVMVGSRTNGADYFVGLRRRKNEFHMLRWLLHDFEKSVEALLGNHVGLIQDENLVAIARWSVYSALTKVSRVVHSVVASSVNLDDIERSTTITR
jgi:hypothetical protein